MKIIFAGTPDFAVHILTKLIQSNHEIQVVYTTPDARAGRGKKVQISPVKKMALNYNIPVLQPINFKEQQAVNDFMNFKTDVMIVVAYGLLLPAIILQTPKLGCINVHASLLPKYRGAAPITYAILNGEKKTGTTIMQMAEGLDTGDILSQESLLVDDNETGKSLHDKLAKQGTDLLLTTLKKIENNEIKPIKQNDKLHSYAYKLTKSQGQINWGDDVIKIERQIRGLNPYPISWCYFNGNPMRIHKATIYDNTSTDDKNIGKIIKNKKNNLLVQTGCGILNLKTLQMPSKKPAPANALINSYDFYNKDLNKLS
ncbi:MAG: methionyl-tRNA formyltransferase [Gammaproteobacteria bacterium]|nr:MAG: methionyl-tRNA formyltransferase [Gammaproteobacteria bacterium]